MIKNFSYYIFLCSFFFILSCKSNTISERAERAVQSDKNGGDIFIGIVDSSGSPNLFSEGVRLAVKEINNNDSIAGRTIVPFFYDDEMSSKKGLEISEKLSKNLNITAVIGHRFSNVAIPASVTYEKNGIVFISPGATDPALTEYSENFTFRNIPSDKEIGRKLAEFADSRKFKKILILYDRESEGKRLAEIFEDEAVKRKIRITARKSYFSWQEDIPLFISDIAQKYDFDAVFLGGVLPFAARIIKELRTLGIKVPILCGTALDSFELPNIAGKSADGTIVATVFDPILSGSIAEKFNKRFKAEYGVASDTHAALGYDAVKVLAFAINKKSGSTEPLTVSTTLHSLEQWNGATGIYSFTRSGDITGKSVFFKEMRNGDFRFIKTDLEPAATGPFEFVQAITLRLPLQGTVSCIDPGLAKDLASYEVCEQLFSGLTEIDPKTGHVIPSLAEKWTSTKDCMQWKFYMQKDAVWTDRTSVTAHDLVWTIQRNINPETKSPNAHLLYIIKNSKNIADSIIADPSQIGVRAIDDFIVEFDLEYPAAWFPALVSLPIYNSLPGKIIEKYKTQWTEPENIVTSGPYEINVWKKDNLMILKKNLKYFDAENVSVENIRYYMMQKSSAGLEMYKNNELDIMGGGYLPLPVSDVLPIKTNPVFNREYRDNTDICTYVCVFNTSTPPADNLFVRKAISGAIDRNLVLKAFSSEYAVPANSFIPLTAYGDKNSSKDRDIFNPVQAREWLIKAGYPQGKGLSELILRHHDLRSHTEISKAVKKIVNHYTNIEIRLSRIDENSDENNKDISDYHMSFYKMCGEYQDPADWLYNPVFNSQKSGWNNADFMRILESARTITDIEKRKKLYWEAEQILIKEAVVVPVFFGNRPGLIKPRIKGWYNMSSGGHHIRNWYLEE